MTGGVAFQLVQTLTDLGGASSDGQSLVVQENRAASNTSGTPTYTVTIANPGSDYTIADTILVLGNQLGGNSPENDLTISIQTIDANGGILTFNQAGAPSSGDAVYEGLTPQQVLLVPL